MYGTLYEPPIWTAHLALTLMLIAMICLVAGFLPAGHIRAKLKFPLLVAIKIWALAHLLANGEPEAVVLFGSFLAWARVTADLDEAAPAQGRDHVAGVRFGQIRSLFASSSASCCGG
jgi:uncharacterized membrane protein